MSALEERSSPLDAALDRAAGETGGRMVALPSGPPSEVVPPSRVRVGGSANGSPLQAALRAVVDADPGCVARVYYDALGATKTTFQGDDGWVVSPDHNVRLKAGDAISNRIDGTPTARTELTGAEGGPVVLAALLASDPADLI